KRDTALTTIADLKRRFPQSRWQKDASALEIEVKQSTGQPVKPADQSDEELKMLAIQGLMNSDSERAMPLLEKVINGAGSPTEKSGAAAEGGWIPGIVRRSAGQTDPCGRLRFKRRCFGEARHTPQLHDRWRSRTPVRGGEEREG